MVTLTGDRKELFDRIAARRVSELQRAIYGQDPEQVAALAVASDALARDIANADEETVSRLLAMYKAAEVSGHCW